MQNIRYIPADSDDNWPHCEILESSDGSIDVFLGNNIFYEDSLGRSIVQKDYKVDGEIWQVHKFDADPHPSRPHAHCIGGRSNFVGLKLHLGTRQLWRGTTALDLLLPKKPFARLIAAIQPKFPNIKLPLQSDLQAVGR